MTTFTVEGESCGPVSSGTYGGSVPGVPKNETTCGGWSQVTLGEGLQVCERKANNPIHTTWTSTGSLLAFTAATSAAGELFSLGTDANGQPATGFITEHVVGCPYP